MSRYQDVELLSFGCRHVNEMSRCRDVVMSSCRVVEVDVEMLRCRDVPRW